MSKNYIKRKKFNCKNMHKTMDFSNDFEFYANKNKPISIQCSKVYMA